MNKSGELARKPKTARGRRIMKKREPKLIEGVKSAMFVKGATCNENMKKILTDLSLIKKPHAVLLFKKNEIRPFEDATSLEFFSKVNDCSLFCFGSHSKKRPNSLTFGRLFDYQLLDMLEFQVNEKTMLTMDDFVAHRKTIARLGTKPMFCFIGEAFDTSEDLGTFKSIILDMFRGEEMDKANLVGLDRVIICTAAVDPTNLTRKVVYFRHYNVLKKKSGSKIPRVELEEVGPRLDLSFNRSTYATKDVRKEAMRIPKGAKPRNEKNIEHDSLGSRYGRVHMEKQDFNKLALAKLKGLGKRDNPNAKRGRDTDSNNDESMLFTETKRQNKIQKKAEVPKAYASLIQSE